MRRYTVGLTAYFTMDLLASSESSDSSDSSGPVLFTLEYMSVSLLGLGSQVVCTAEYMGVIIRVIVKFGKQRDNMEPLENM